MKNKNINNCTDIKFIYPSNRSALSYTDLKKTTKSSQILWMMHQKRVKTLFIRIMEKYICWSPAESMWIFLWYSGSQLFVWLFMCEIREHANTILSKKEHWECWRQMPRSIEYNQWSCSTYELLCMVWTLLTWNCDYYSKSICALSMIKLQYMFICVFYRFMSM